MSSVLFVWLCSHNVLTVTERVFFSAGLAATHLYEELKSCLCIMRGRGRAELLSFSFSSSLYHNSVVSAAWSTAHSKVQLSVLTLSLFTVGSETGSGEEIDGRLKMRVSEARLIKQDWLYCGVIREREAHFYLLLFTEMFLLVLSHRLWRPTTSSFMYTRYHMICISFTTRIRPI